MANGSSQTEDAPFDKPKPGKLPIKIKDPLEPRNPPAHQVLSNTQPAQVTSLASGGRPLTLELQPAQEKLPRNPKEL